MRHCSDCSDSFPMMSCCSWLQQAFSAIPKGLYRRTIVCGAMAASYLTRMAEVGKEDREPQWQSVSGVRIQYIMPVEEIACSRPKKKRLQHDAR